MIFGIVLLVFFIFLSLYKNKILILVYIASLGWIPYQAGKDALGALNLDNLILLAVCILSLPVLFSSNFKMGPLAKISIIYWGISLLSNIMSATFYPMWANFIFRQMLKDFAVLYFIIVLDRRLQEKTFVPQLALALVIAALGAVTTTLIDYFVPNIGIAQLWQQSEKLSIAEGGLVRYGGALQETYLSGAFIMGAIGVGLSILVNGKGMYKERLLAFILIPICLFAILAGQSRSTYIGVMVISCLAFMKPQRAIFGIMLLIFGYFLIHANPEMSERFFARFVNTADPLSGRSEIWFQYLANIPPIAYFIGEGFTTMTFRTDFAGHMSYIEILADVGIFGLLVFTSLWYFVIVYRRKIQANAVTQKQYVYGMAGFLMAIGFLVSSAGVGFVVNNTYRILFLTWLAIAIAPAWNEPAAIEQIEEDYSGEVVNTY